MCRFDLCQRIYPRYHPSCRIGYGSAAVYSFLRTQFLSCVYQCVLQHWVFVCRKGRYPTTAACDLVIPQKGERCYGLYIHQFWLTLTLRQTMSLLDDWTCFIVRPLSLTKFVTYWNSLFVVWFVEFCCVYWVIIIETSEMEKAVSPTRHHNRALEFDTPLPFMMEFYCFAFIRIMKRGWFAAYFTWRTLDELSDCENCRIRVRFSSEPSARDPCFSSLWVTAVRWPNFKVCFRSSEQLWAVLTSRFAARYSNKYCDIYPEVRILTAWAGTCLLIRNRATEVRRFTPHAARLIVMVFEEGVKIALGVYLQETEKSCCYGERQLLVRRWCGIIQVRGSPLFARAHDGSTKRSMNPVKTHYLSVYPIEGDEWSWLI